MIKEDCQAFGLLVGKVKSQEEALAYPLTSIPLALANPDHTFRQGSKATLRNYLIEESDALCSPPEDADWFIDGMATVLAVKVAETWEEFGSKFLKHCKPEGKVNRLFIIFDSYNDSSIKQMTQLGRGKPGRNVYITNLKQNMPKPSDWPSFLRNSHNKTQLIKALVLHFKSIDVRKNLKYELIVTEEEKTWKISRNSIVEPESSNHVEADTRIIMEALKSEGPVIVKAADTDILVLMCYAHTKENQTNEWMMQIDSERFVDIKAIQIKFGQDVSRVLPSNHSITGCDTTSYPANVGKIKPLKKMIKHDKVTLLENFG